MPQAASKSPGIFICYRHEDCAGHAGRLYDRLAAHFGDERVFMDVAGIDAGEKFEKKIDEALNSCEVMIALIGRHWLAKSERAGRYFDNPKDFVRREIAAALRRDLRVIPALVQRAPLPRPQDLPEDLLPLLDHHAFELSDQHWNSDVGKLLVAMERALKWSPASRLRPKRRAAALAGAAALVLAAAAVYAVWQPGRGVTRVRTDGGASAAKTDAAVLENRVRELDESGQFDEAVRAATEAINLNRNSAAAYYIRGTTYMRGGDYNRAVDDYDEALRLDPNYAKAFSKRALAYREMGAFDKAIEDATKAITLGLDPQSAADAYNTRGAAHFDKGDYDPAIKDATEAISLSPKFRSAYFNRGTAYLKKGDFRRAVRDYEEVIRRDPKNALAYNNRADSYEALGMKDLAAADRRKAEELRRAN